MTALNGEPEPSVGIEAIGSGSPQCTEYHEETNSESNGQFRLRGLVPQVTNSSALNNIDLLMLFFLKTVRVHGADEERQWKH